MDLYAGRAIFIHPRYYHSSDRAELVANKTHGTLRIDVVEKRKQGFFYNSSVNVLFVCKNEEFSIGKEIAIMLSFYNNMIRFEFYNVGEKYSPSDKSIVRKKNTIIKTVEVLQGQRWLDLSAFYEKYRDLSDFNMMKNKVEKRPLIIKKDTTYNDTAPKEKSSFNSSFYNDSLDMDQQDPNFWDSLEP